jgi:hypothetical protein
MKTNRGLIAAIAGVAMLAVPITASAANRNRGEHTGALSAAPSSALHSSTLRNFASNRTFTPRAEEGRGLERSAAAWANRNFAAHEQLERAGGALTPYPNYGSLPAAPVFVPPAVGYAAPYNACAEAQRAINIAHHDRNTGHPAAANDVLRNHSNALASCPQVSDVRAYGSYGNAAAPA